MKLTEQFDELVEDYINSQGWIKPGANIYDYNKREKLLFARNLILTPVKP